MLEIVNIGVDPRILFVLGIQLTNRFQTRLLVQIWVHRWLVLLEMIWRFYFFEGVGVLVALAILAIVVFFQVVLLVLLVPHLILSLARHIELFKCTDVLFKSVVDKRICVRWLWWDALIKGWISSNRRVEIG